MKGKKQDKENLKVNLDQIKNKIVVLSGKGGVGKSTVSANIALALSENGYNVGLMDADMHGPSIPTILGVENKKPTGKEESINPIKVNEKLHVISVGFFIKNKDSAVIWRGPMKMGAIKQFLKDVKWGKLDYLIIDLPPGTGDEPLSIAQLIEDIDGAIIVTTPQNLALTSVRKSINFVKKLNIEIIGIIENMSGFTCPNCGKKINIFKKGGGRKTAKDFEIPLLGEIPIDPEIVENGDKGGTKSLKYFKEIVKNIEKNK